MSIEFELKFAATAQAHQQIRETLGGEFASISMETTYFDTPGGDFSGRKWTLRRRRENGIFVCTLKTPADGSGRNEWEVCSDSIQAAVPELCKLSGSTELATLAAEGLIPICGARFTRLAKTIPTGTGEVEVALDAGVLLGADREMPLREVEVELKSGSPEEATAFARVLAQRFGLTPEPRSKFRRAFDLARNPQKED